MIVHKLKKREFKHFKLILGAIEYTFSIFKSFLEFLVTAIIIN